MRFYVEQVIDPKSSTELSYAGTTRPTTFLIASFFNHAMGEDVAKVYPRVAYITLEVSRAFCCTNVSRR